MESAPTDIEARLRGVRERIARAAERAGRSPSEVGLVVVSKKQPPEAIGSALRAGCVDFGESYVQELQRKAAAVPGSPRWHFVGHLQRNKINALLGVEGLVLVHAVDSQRLLEALEARATGPLDVLLQVDLAGEPTKGGCAPDDLPAIVAAARGCEHVRLRGLMNLPPAAADPEQARPYFRRLRALRDELEVGPELSMGMSHDYEIAIEEGATWVRIGTAILGSRRGG